jgi:hypothetical protein
MTEVPTLQIDWLELIKSLFEVVLPRSDDILSSPAKLGSLLTICSDLAEIEPIVRHRAATLALEKKEILGWTLVHRDGNRYVQAELLIELGLQCPLSNLQQLLTELASQLGNISESKYQLLCQSAGLAPLADAVKQTGATVFLRRNPTTNNLES